MPKYGWTPSTLHIPDNALSPATHACACFAAAARSSCIVGQVEPTSISDAADALPPVAMVQIGIHVSYVSRPRCVGRYECCSYSVVWGVKS